MIVHIVWTVLGHLFAFMVGLFPTWTEPAWVQSTADTLTGFFQNVGAYSYFIPLGTIVVCASFVLLCVGIAFAIRTVRIGISTFTGGGGSAA